MYLESDSHLTVLANTADPILFDPDSCRIYDSNYFGFIQWYWTEFLNLNTILFSYTLAYIFVESERFVRINLEWCICWLSNASFKFNAQLVIYL